MNVLVVGDGWFAGLLTERLGASGVDVGREMADDERRGRRPASSPRVDQIVVVPDPGTGLTERAIERVDDHRWLVCSWNGAQRVGDAHAVGRSRSPEEAAAMSGATVLHLPTVFGHGLDDNVTRLARNVRRSHGLAEVASGGRLVQPLHCDDLVTFVDCHRRRPSGGLYEIAGPEAVPVVEVWESVLEILGAGIGRVRLPKLISHLLSRLGNRVQEDVHWGFERAPVDIRAVCDAFDWQPMPLGIRLEQAVHEAFS